MRTAKQWVDEVIGIPLWDKMDPEKFIKAVQLDAWKHGMTDAADLAEKGRSYAAAKYIREKRDATKSV